jgi:hypothetical protein
MRIFACFLQCNNSPKPDCNKKLCVMGLARAKKLVMKSGAAATHNMLQLIFK